MDSDAGSAIAPALAPEDAVDQHALAHETPEPRAPERRAPDHGRAVTHVTGGGPIQYGEAVQFELAFADGSRERFHAACEDFPRIVSDLRGFAGLAQRARNASPDRPVEVVNPYQATEARTDRVGAMIVVRFPTLDGIPLLVAMDATVADTLLRGLERELTRL